MTGAPRTRFQVQLVPLTTVWQVWVLLQGIDSQGERTMSSSGGGRNPGLAVFRKTHTWYYSLEHLGYHCFHPFEVHCRGSFFFYLKNIYFKKKSSIILILLIYVSGKEV